MTGVLLFTSVLEGWVKIRTYNLDGKEVTLNILGKGELVKWQL